MLSQFGSCDSSRGGEMDGKGGNEDVVHYQKSRRVCTMHGGGGIG
jgi:hypothetical protein